MKDENKFYIGYGSGDNGLLYPDVFTARPSVMNGYIGKSWGSYVWVAGPFDSYNDANVAHTRSNTYLPWKDVVG